MASPLSRLSTNSAGSTSPFRESRVRAARETAAAIACFERPLQRRRNGARLAADVERLAFFALDNAHERSFAAEPPHGLQRKRPAVVELAAKIASGARSYSRSLQTVWNQMVNVKTAGMGEDRLNKDQGCRRCDPRAS
jgi:hypothetical protein